MSKKSSHSSGVIYAVTLTLCLSLSNQAQADGLGGLVVVGWLFYAILAVLGFGVAVAVPALIMAFRLRGRSEEHTPRTPVLIAVGYVLFLFPVAFLFLLTPTLNFWLYGSFVIYLVLSACTILYFYLNKKRVFGGVALILVLALVRTPEIISYTQFEFVENVPFDDSIGLTEQKDIDYLQFEDGRLFYIEQRYNSLGISKKFPPDSRFSLTPVAEEPGLFNLTGLGRSLQYQEHLGDVTDPLLTIPLRTVEIDRYAASQIGQARVLEDTWQADNSVLQRATNMFCCDPEWIQELLRRGADASVIYSGSGMTLLHTIGNKPPYGPNHIQTARLLIRNRANVNLKDGLGRSAFHATLKHLLSDVSSEDRLDTQRDYLRVLLELGANPNTQDKDLKTPLHDTLVARFYGLSHLLLEYGADPTRADKSGRSALKLATHYLRERKNVLSDAEELALANLIVAMESKDRVALRTL